MCKKMPSLFVGHGSPMNAIEDNMYTEKWLEIADEIGRPKAILSISAHWYTKGSRITDSPQLKTIYDMYGFPKELYEVKYDVQGSPEFAQNTINLISKSVSVDNSWGCDHGTWSVLCRMYPNADIPVYQLSIDYSIENNEHFKIGQEIAALRDKGVMIMGSGNIVHNLSRLNWNMNGGYSWADEFDNYIKDKILLKEYNDIIQYKKAGESADFAFTSPDHFIPLLYVLGATKSDDELVVFNDSCTMGSLSMTSYLFK